ncbi:neprilysin-1-like isoform X2 [Eriocheir sinensis]|uniref:neprilysin-1-like isoform X2 n=1 Tax=Eriocheir sinensis TaxID=95602 RepID=UPI0021C84C02|nr:neprilysin-1-like isoform X2 [Eriocheir sinensis]
MSQPQVGQPRAPEGTAGEERRPIVTGQHNGVTPHGPGNNPPNYNSMTQANPNLDGLRDPQGGYVGPAAPFSYQHPGDPDSLPPRYSSHDPGARRQRDNDDGLSCLKSWVLLGSCCLLGILAALLGILVFAGAVPLFRHLWPNTCTSAECYKAVGNILESLKEDVNPCEDFAKYVCGGWRREHPLPESKYRWGIFDDLNEKTLLDARGMLEEDVKENETRTIRITKTVYQACVNSSRWEEVGQTPLLTLLAREGGLPMLEPEWSGADFEVMSKLARLRRTLALTYLVGVTVEPDSRNTSRNLIHLSEGRLSMPREYYTPDSALSRYQKAKRTYFMRQTGELLLTARQQERNVTYLDNLYRDVDDLWAFSVRAAEITDPDEDLLTPWDVYNPMTVAQLQAATDAANASVRVDWLRFLNDVFEETGIQLTAAQEVVVDRPLYFPRLVALLQETPARVLANYLLFPLVTDMGTEVTGQVLASLPQREATWSLGRTTTRSWFDCGKKVNLLLPFGVGALYTRHHLAPVTQGLAGEVVGDVTAAFRTMLTEASWMDAETLTEALQKLDAMKHLVAYPPLALLDDLLEEYHVGLPDVRPDDHFGNILSLTAWLCRRSLLELTLPTQRDSWPRGPLELNAFNDPQFNAIMIPLALLQPPIFTPERLTALNYGSLGAIIGHETTHGFDNSGRMMDAHGNLNHWWSNATRQQYLNKTECFVKQYSAFNAAALLSPHQRPSEPMLINGKRTVGENIADNGGLRAAWAAYRRRLAKDGSFQSLTLPGLDRFTDDQLFFVSFAKVWCSQITPYALQYVLRADVHAPDPYRVLGTLQNSPEFAQAFNCPAGAPMNPKEKCVLW